MTIGQVIKTQRMKRRLSQADLANELGLSQGYLSQIECGSKKPSMELCADFSYFFGIPQGVFFFMTIEESQIHPDSLALYKQQMPSFMDFLSKLKFVIE